MQGLENGCAVEPAGPAAAVACAAGQGQEHDNDDQEQEDPILYDQDVLEELRDSKLRRLRELRPFVLDNSLRETNVAAIRGHTLKDKWELVRLVKESNMGQYLVASFNALKQVDDQFVLDMKAKGVMCNKCFGFSECWEKWDAQGVPLMDVPLGLAKMRAYGVTNAVLEANFACRATNWDRFGEDGLFELLEERCRWAVEHLSPPASPAAAAPGATPQSTPTPTSEAPALPTGQRRASCFINIRDFVTAMEEAPGRVLHVARRLGGLPREHRPVGLLFEEPSGGRFPFEVGPLVARLRQAMTEGGWADGHLLVHVHHNYGLAQAVVLECLASGCDGVWAALCDEGAATGHAGSFVTLVNLDRLGNPHVRQQYDLQALRRAAADMTRVVTGEDPHPRTEVYGARAAALEPVL